MQTIQEAQILIVDDSREMRDLLKEELNSAGYHHLHSADSVKSARTEDGYAPDSSLAWQQHFAWAMLLSDSGEILWSEHLPAELNHPYTVPEVAAFSRWYLKDYPVMVYRNDYGLLVAGKPIGSLTRFDFYMDNDMLYALLSTLVLTQ